MLRASVLTLMGLFCLLVSGEAVFAQPAITDISAPTSAGLYQKCEIAFKVSTVAANYYWPYDPQPAANTAEHPNAVPAGVGVTVDGLFSRDGWQTTVVQPGFYCEEMQDGYPTGVTGWRVRFAPTSIGEWKYRIRVTDASGTTTSPEGSFTCVQSSNRGFVRVSPTDTRYFETSDGTSLNFVGLAHTGKEDISKLAAMGVNLIRSWWTSFSADRNAIIFGANGGNPIWHNCTYDSVYARPGQLAVAKIPLSSSNPDVFQTMWAQPTVKPLRKYRMSALVKTVGIVGTGDYGVCLFTQASSTRSRRLTGNNDWTELTLDFTSLAGWNYITIGVGSQYVTGGTAYCARVSLKEDLGGGQYGIELIPQPDFQAHMSYPQTAAAYLDSLLDKAAENDVYVRAVIMEKQDPFFSCIQADGTWGTRDDGNVYASPTHAGRTYQTYYWRYLIARYGYSTSLHSIEFCNEADPNSEAYYAAVAALGRYFRENDPNRHLVSSSNWHSFPPKMWSDPNIDVADLHMYLGWEIASGGNRIWPGWDGFWSQMNNASDPADPGLSSGFQWDTTISHGPGRSLKITVPPMPGDHRDQIKIALPKFQCGAPPGHTLRCTLWVKGQNLVTYNQSWIAPGGIHLQYSQAGGDFAGYPDSTGGTTQAPWGTYDWRQVQATFVVPSASLPGTDGRVPLILTVQPFVRANNSSSAGTIWIDDLVIEDLTTGKVLNYNGGFEEIEPVSYDVVAAHCSYSRLVNGYSVGKPVIRGETAFCHPLRFSDPYKGFPFEGTDTQPGQDQLLIDDTSGVWWRKWVWANVDPGGLVEIYWWPSIPVTREFKHAKAFQSFMSGIPLSNGNYRDVNASVSNPALRVLGQKDLVNNRAHLWIDNKPYTWKNVVDGVVVPPASGTVTVSGFKDGSYNVEWWDTTTGQITNRQTVQCTAGSIGLSVSNLVSDAACKIYPASSEIQISISTSSGQVVPGQTVTVTVTYTNTGASPAANVQIRALVPEQMTYIAGTAEATGGSYNESDRSVTWTIANVAAGETGSRTFQARVN